MSSVRYRSLLRSTFEIVVSSLYWSYNAAAPDIFQSTGALAGKITFFSRWAALPLVGIWDQISTEGVHGMKKVRNHWRTELSTRHKFIFAVSA